MTTVEEGGQRFEELKKLRIAKVSFDRLVQAKKALLANREFVLEAPRNSLDPEITPQNFLLRQNPVIFQDETSEPTEVSYTSSYVDSPNSKGRWISEQLKITKGEKQVGPVDLRTQIVIAAHYLKTGEFDIKPITGTINFRRTRDREQESVPDYIFDLDADKILEVELPEIFNPLTLDMQVIIEPTS